MISVVLLTMMVFALVGQAAWVATGGLRQADGSVMPIAQRVEAYTQLSWQPKPLDSSSILRRTRFSRTPWLDHLLQRFDMSESLSRDLLRAGAPLKAGEFLFVQLITMTLAGFASFVFLSSLGAGVLPTIVACVLGYVAPLVWLRQRASKRLQLFERELSDSLVMVAGSLRAGFGIAHGFELVARENDGPCGEEFGQVMQEVALGADIDTALSRITERTNSEDARLLATAVGVQRRTGGNLVDVLQQMAGTIRERQRLRAEVHVITTAPRMSGYVVALLPVLLAAGMFFTQRRDFDLMLSEPLGRIVLVVSGSLALIGMMLNRQIASVEM